MDLVCSELHSRGRTVTTSPSLLKYKAEREREQLMIERERVREILIGFWFTFFGHFFFKKRRRSILIFFAFQTFPGRTR